MKTCPICGQRAGCIDSRPVRDATRRRYGCPSGHRYTTVEVLVDTIQGKGTVVSAQAVMLKEQRAKIADLVAKALA